MSRHVLKKQYTNHFGMDLKSSDLNRKIEFSSGMMNALYSKSGALEKRKGFQATGTSQAGFGLYVYNRINPTTGVEEPELLNVSGSLYKKKDSTITITYVGADPMCAIDIFYDTVTSQYRCKITEGQTTALDMALGVGFDEASPVTINTLKTTIDALANYTATLTGDTSTPAAFLPVVRQWDLSSTGGPLITSAFYWSEVNKTITSPFAGSVTNKNSDSFENVSAVQVKNLMFFSNGYDEVQKYDGQTLYRAGLPVPASISSALGVGAVTGTKYYHKATYVQIDAVGNIVDGDVVTTSVGLDPTAQGMDVTVANIQAGTGFNTNCAIVAGAQTTVTTITVDNGSGGANTMNIGDTAYFYDSVSASYVEREVTGRNATTITIAGAAVTVADNAVISNNLRIALYRNETSAVVPSVYYLVEELPNNSFAATQVYNDNKADAALGYEFIDPIFDKGLPAKGKYITAFRNQLFITGNNDYQTTVFFSDVECENFPILNQFRVDTSHGDVITGIAPNNEVLAIFKTKSIYIMSGNITDLTIRIDHLTNDIGCVSHQTIKEIRGALFFLTQKGPYFMINGQVPVPLGEDRIEPVFRLNPLAEEEILRLKRSIGFHDRYSEQYWLYIPAEETLSGNIVSNSNSRLFVFDYSRGAWLEWDTINLSGGAAELDGEVYWVEKAHSTFSSANRYILYKKHSIDDAWAYQDNTESIPFEYKTQWESLGEPSVFKKFIALRIFALEETINNELILNVKTEVNFTKEDSKADFDIQFSNTGYGNSAYGTAGYGDPFEAVIKHKLSGGKFRSLRLIYSNNVDQANVGITGWELEIAQSFKSIMKT